MSREVREVDRLPGQRVRAISEEPDSAVGDERVTDPIRRVVRLARRRDGRRHEDRRREGRRIGVSVPGPARPGPGADADRVRVLVGDEAARRANPATRESA